MQSLTRIALVTGAASGFGTAAARLLASHGIKVACCDRSFIHKSPSSDLVNAIQGEGNTLFCGMDTLNSKDVENVLDAVQAAYGQAPTILVNTEHLVAGEEILGKMRNPHSLESFREVIDRNVAGDFNLIRLAARRMTENPRSLDGERGVIINTSSMAAVDGSGAMIAFSTAMAAISGMTLPLARSLGRYGIRCVCIQPGLFNTSEMKDYEDTINLLTKMTPFPRRLGEPEEFASLVETVILNPMLNGCNIRLDGGIRS